jgi:hypothetical protein
MATGFLSLAACLFLPAIGINLKLHKIEPEGAGLRIPGMRYREPAVKSRLPEASGQEQVASSEQPEARGGPLIYWIKRKKMI